MQDDSIVAFVPGGRRVVSMAATLVRPSASAFAMAAGAGDPVSSATAAMSARFIIFAS